MYTKIPAGIISLIGAIFIIIFIEYVYPHFLFGIVSLLIGLFLLYLGKSVDNHKKWSWFVAITIFLIITIFILIEMIYSPYIAYNGNLNTWFLGYKPPVLLVIIFEYVAALLVILFSGVILSLIKSRDYFLKADKQTIDPRLKAKAPALVVRDTFFSNKPLLDAKKSNYVIIFCFVIILLVILFSIFPIGKVQLNFEFYKNNKGIICGVNGYQSYGTSLGLLSFGMHSLQCCGEKSCVNPIPNSEPEVCLNESFICQ